MPQASSPAVEITLRINEEERVLLLNFLEHAHREKLVEEHRTDAPDYREHLLREESVLKNLIDKLRRS